MNGSPLLRAKLCALFFIQAHGIALWYVPFSNVLRAHGLEALAPYAFACSSIAAFVSPMLVGTLADRHFSAERILRWLLVGGAILLALTFLAIQWNWGAGWVLAFLQLEQLCAAPTWGLSTAIVLANLRQPEREFGPVRVWATFGWMAAGLLLSFVLKADSSTLSGFVAVAVWLGVAAFTLTLPHVPPSASAGGKRWRDVLGWDAFVLLKNPDHRSVFVTAALFSIPLAAFYPFTVLHLRDAGESRVSAAMSLGQISEAIAMYALAPLLLRFRLKTVFLAGITVGVIRYAMFAADTLPWVLAGVSLHGLCFTLFFISAQIYLERRVDPEYRTRAQALLTFMISGVGNFVGALSTGWLRQWCAGPQGTDWRLYWTILCGATLAVGVYFAATYRRGNRLHSGADESAGALPSASEPVAASTPE